jgi:FixJ family two-component response regulator
MPPSHPVVFLLDDDVSVATVIGRMLQPCGFVVRTWTCAAEFLAAHEGDTPGCLVTDIRMPGMSGLEVQRALAARGIERPVVYITGLGDIRYAVQVMRAGAVSCLTKPVQRQELIAAVSEAISRDAARRACRCQQQELSGRLARLTPRERQVLGLLADGMLNKQIAAELGASEKTIKVHRGRVMEKMQVRTATALVRLLSRAGHTELHAGFHGSGHDRHGAILSKE